MRCAPVRGISGLALVLAHARVVQQGGDRRVRADGEETICQQRPGSLLKLPVEQVRIGTVDRVQGLRKEIRGQFRSLEASLSSVERPRLKADAVAWARVDPVTPQWSASRAGAMVSSDGGWRTRTRTGGSSSRAVGGMPLRREPGRPDDQLCWRVSRIERRWNGARAAIKAS